MATKRTTELKAMAVDALLNELKELSSELKQMNFDHSVKGIQNPLQIRSLRKEIARVNTELRARELSEMSDEAIAKRSRIRLRRK